MVNRKLRFNLKETRFLNNTEIDEIWNVYSGHHNATFSQFMDRTFNQFGYMAICRDAQTQKIVGFTGIRIANIQLKSGKDATAIYFGQTFIRSEYRGCNLLKFCAIQIGLKCKLTNPFKPSYIWFDAISYKPFLLLSKYSGECYPSIDREMPEDIKKLIDTLGYRYYPNQYNPNNGTVIKTCHRLRDNDTRIHNYDLNNQYIRFYAEKNPGHTRGDGLICVLPNTFYNYFIILRKVVSKSLSKRLSAVAENSTSFFPINKVMKYFLQRANS